MEDYLKQFVHKFKEEALGLLTQLEEELLELEASKATKSHLETIFRVMHTLKGTAGMYGFENIQNLTHHLETVYDLIRDGTLRIDSHILEVTLISVDHIKNLLSDEELLVPDNKKKQDELLVLLLELVSKPIEEHEEIKVDEEAQPLATFYIMFTVGQRLLDRGISLLNLFRDLAELGKFFIINGYEIEGDDSGDRVWGVYLVSDKGRKDIAEVFLFVEENIEVRKIADINLFENEEFALKMSQIDKASSPNDKRELQQSILELVEVKYKAIHPEISDLTSPSEHTPSAEPTKQIDNITRKQQEVTRISVNAQKLDLLMHLVTELVTTQSQFSLAIQNEDMRSLREVYERSQKLAKQFRDNTLDIRLIPIGDILVRFKRLIRDLSKQLGKDIEFVTEGMDTELDKSMIDSLSEPLLHLIRNSIDHGIELPEKRIARGKTAKGKVELKAFNSGSHVYIEVYDDGAGIDTATIKSKAIAKGLWAKDVEMSEKEAFDMIFKPGFTTTTNVTAVSGRGVGMDIVKRKLAEMRGEIKIESSLHKYTRFVLKLQPTIAIIDTMLVKVEDTYCLIPISDIEICDQMDSKELARRAHIKTISYHDTPTAFVNLRERLSLSDKLVPQKSKLLFITLQGHTFAVVVDKIIGEHQAVLKPLGEEFQSQHVITSASTLGDGSLAFMLDMNALWQQVEESHSSITL